MKKQRFSYIQHGVSSKNPTERKTNAAKQRLANLDFLKFSTISKKGTAVKTSEVSRFFRLCIYTVMPKYEAPQLLLFRELFKFNEACDMKPKPDWCVRLQRYITENMKKKFNLDDLAKMLFISQSSLCHKFKETVARRSTGRQIISQASKVPSNRTEARD